MKYFLRFIASALFPVFVMLALSSGCDNSGNVFHQREQNKKDAEKAKLEKKRKTAERLGRQQREMAAEALRGTNADPNRGR